MADLDDFFAKKDKKKSRTAVKKFTASELMTSAPLPKAPVVTPSEESARKVEISSEAAPPLETAPVLEPAAPAKPRAAPEHEEEEWGEFEQEKEKDYSGLKIQKLQIQDSDGEEEDDEGEHELNEEGELVKREPAGPWNKIGSQQGPAQTQVKAKEQQVVEAPPHTAGGVYIPPSMRNKTAGGPGSGSGSTNRTRTGKKDKGAPDLNSEEFFPTLSAAVAIEQNNFKLKKFEQTERGFTEAKPSRSHSNRSGPGGVAPGEDGPRLNLGNKFNALSNDE